MDYEIQLLRIRVDSLEDYREKTKRIRKETKKTDRFQLCIKSSLLDERFSDEMLAEGAAGARYLLRIEADAPVSAAVLYKIRHLLHQVVVIAGYEQWVRQLEHDCGQTGISFRNFLQEKNNVCSQMCRYKEKTDAYLTEKKLTQAIREYASFERQDSPGLDDTAEIILIPAGAGLACQIFSYLFAVYADQNTNRKVILDDSGNYIRNSRSGKDKFIDELMWNYHIDKNEAEKCAEKAYQVISHFQFEGLELAEIFSLKLPLLSSYFTKEEWGRLIETCCGRKFSQIPEILEIMGYSVCLVRDNTGVEFQNNLISMVYETGFRDVYKDGSDDERRLKDILGGNLHNLYFSVLATAGDICDSLFCRRKWVRSVLKFPELTDQVNKRIYMQMSRVNAVIIHIRRGEKIYSGWTLDCGYYRAAIDAAESLKIDETTDRQKIYFLFSDSVQWCREHEVELGLDRIRDRLVYAEANTGKDSYKDMQLMSRGTVMIPSPASSFGICALLFGSVRKCVDTKIFLQSGKISVTDILEE